MSSSQKMLPQKLKRGSAPRPGKGCSPYAYPGGELLEGLRPSNPGKGACPFATPFFQILKAQKVLPMRVNSVTHVCE